MATLEGNTIAASYPLLLKVEDTGFGTSLKQIEDGDGTDSCLSLTADTGGKATLKIIGDDAAGTSAEIWNTHANGDSLLYFRNDGVYDWTMGIDVSHANTFKIYRGADLAIEGTGGPNFQIQTSGKITVGNDIPDDYTASRALEVYDADADSILRIKSVNDDAMLEIAADVTKNSYLDFMCSDGDASKCSIYYDHNATQNSQKLNILVGDGARNAMRVTGDGKVLIGTNNSSNDRASLTVDVGSGSSMPEYYIGEETSGFTLTTSQSGGGWSRGLNAVKRSDETRLARFGFYGGDDTLIYQFIGKTWDAPTIVIMQDTYKVGIGNRMDAPLANLHIHKDVGADSSYGMFMLEDTGASEHHKSGIANSRQAWTTFCSRALANNAAGGHFKFYCSNGWNELWVATTADVLWCQFYINSDGEYSRGHVIAKGTEDTTYVSGAELRSFSEYFGLTHDAAASNRATMKITNLSTDTGKVHWGYLRSYTARMQIISGTYDE